MLRSKAVFLVILMISLILFSCASDEEKKAAHFEKGLAYFEKGDYKAARLEFKNAIQIDAKYTQAYQKLASIWMAFLNSRLPAWSLKMPSNWTPNIPRLIKS